MHKWTEERKASGGFLINIGQSVQNIYLTLMVRDVNLLEMHEEFIDVSEYNEMIGPQPCIEGVISVNFRNRYEMELGIAPLYCDPLDILKIKREIEDILGLFPKTKTEVVITEDGVELK